MALVSRRCRGTKGSSDLCLLGGHLGGGRRCAKAVSFAASAELRDESWAIMFKALARLPALCRSAALAPPLEASRSMNAVARSSNEMTLTSSLSSLATSAASLSRISVAAFSSASSVKISAARASILAVAEAAGAAPSAITAWCAMTWDLPL